MESHEGLRPPKQVTLTVPEFARLIICILFDVVEYAFPILLGPLVGDLLDIAGFWTSILMFGWIGCISILELIPMADFFPIFFFTWVIWYYRKKRTEKKMLEKMQKEWK